MVLLLRWLGRAGPRLPTAPFLARPLAVTIRRTERTPAVI